MKIESESGKVIPVRTGISLLCFLLLGAQALFSEEEYPGEPGFFMAPDSLETEQVPVYKTAWATRVGIPPLIMLGPGPADHGFHAEQAG